MKLRVRFAKHGKVRFTSHRDVARIWERAIRRAGLPIAYSEGFSPHPKLSFGLALSTGYESDGEYLDLELADPCLAEGETPVGVVLGVGPAAGRWLPISGLAPLLTDALPEGIEVQALTVLDGRVESLQQAVTLCTWSIQVRGISPDGAQSLVEQLLQAESLPVTRERKGKETTDDLRPAIRRLAVVGPVVGGVELEAELDTQPRSVRPTELLRALGPDLDEALVCRTHQWIERDGARREPVLLEATNPAAAEARAS